jgi:hypothetical protein
MASFVLRDLIPSKILLLAACALAFVYIQAPVATAQRVGGAHPIGGARTAAPRPVVPPAARTPAPRTTVSHPRFITSPRLGVPGARFGFRPGANNIFFRRRLFFRAPFFRFGPAFGLNFAWSPYCSPYWTWGNYCNGLPFYGYANGFENYVTLQPYDAPAYTYGYQAPAYTPIYTYGERELVWLYLKDGTAYGVSDYWFVDDQVHFIPVDEAGAKSIEQTIPFDELDAQKTIAVNGRRGFRVVKRDAPMEQYMHDHPDLAPPLLESSPSNPPSN